MPSPEIAALMEQAGGIMLDIGCGSNKMPGSIGIDIRPGPGVDIIHDLDDYPWPLPDACCLSVFARHVVEHICPRRFGMIRFMDECWRLLKPGRQLAIITPHAYSIGFAQDPTHCNPCNEKTWIYFDPIWSAEFAKASGSDLYRIYQPKPWKVESLSWNPQANIEVILAKRRGDISYTEAAQAAAYSRAEAGRIA